MKYLIENLKTLNTLIMDMGILKSLIYQTKCNMCDLVIEIIEKENINLELSEKEIISISVIE